jgi:hypothetical protein
LGTIRALNPNSINAKVSFIFVDCRFLRGHP